MTRQPNSLLLIQCTCYGIAVILGVCAFLPMSFNLFQFRGRCLLFTGGTFNESNGWFEPIWSTVFYCAYTLIVSGFALIVALFSTVKTAQLLYRNTDSSFLSAFWDSVISVLLSIFILIDAILVSLGFSRWCRTVTQRFSACENAYNMTIVDDVKINPSGFYFQIGCVQFGIWSLLVVWTLIVVLAVRKVYLYHERENLIVSMARQRRRYAASSSRDS